MTPKLAAALKEVLDIEAKATPGPWHPERWDAFTLLDFKSPSGKANAMFIKAVRNLFATHADELRRLADETGE